MCLDAGSDALDTIHAAVGADEFDEIIVCTKPEHLARDGSTTIFRIASSTSACPSA